MGDSDADGSVTALTVALTVDEEMDSPGVRVATWEELHDVGEDDVSLPPLTASEIPDEPVSVRPLRRGPGFADLGEIGRGGMGAIRYVTDNRLLRQMALKTLPEGVSASSDGGRRFIEEAQITGQLDHPNIVPVHTLGKGEDGSLYFTMKLVRGKTLSDVLGELGHRRLDARELERLVQVIMKVCDAVAFAHSRGVVHRDLKPSNVMLGSYGQVYVMDWGLALLCQGPRLVSDRGKIIGTPGYMSPEQAFSVDEVDERADVYGVGSLLYRILTGRRPHPGATHVAALRHTRDGLVRHPADVCDAPLPPELCRITMRALAFEREARYQTIDELRVDLEEFLRGGGWLATRDYAAGDVIIQEGDDAFEAYIIVSGVCEAYKGRGDNRRVLREMGPGEVFGETAILTGKPRTASVAAQSDVRVKVVTAASLENELARNGFLGPFVRALAERFRELDARITGSDTKS